LISKPKPNSPNKALEPAPARRELFLSMLLNAWESEGFVLGTDKHLVLQELLQHLPDTLELAKLKGYLAPILTENAQNQRDFYRIFDQTLDESVAKFEEHQRYVTEQGKLFKWNALKKKLQQAANAPNTYWKQMNPKKRNQVALFLVALLLTSLAALVYFDYQNYTKPVADDQKVSYFIPVNLLDGRKLSLCFDRSGTQLGNVVRVTRLAPKESVFVAVQDFISLGNFCLEYQGLNRGRETMRYQVCFEGEKCIEMTFTFRVDIFQSIVPPVSKSGGKMAFNIQPFELTLPKTGDDQPPGDEVVKLPLRQLERSQSWLDTAQLTSNPGKYVAELDSGWRFGAGYAYFTPTKLLLSAIVALLLFLLGLWLRHKRQKFTIQQQGEKTAPYVWTMRIPLIDHVFMGDQFYLAVTEMRRRSLSETRRFDMPKTIRASVQSGGMIDFKYKNQFRNKDYLFLLDAQEAENLNSRLPKLILQELQANEVPIEVFFYNGDIRHCWNEKYPQGISLLNIQHKYREHQLVVWGNVDTLFQASKNELAPWTIIFDDWNKRALLRIRPVSDWDEIEAVLAQKFRILPGTPTGIANLVETLEAVDPKSYLLWKDVEDKTINPVSLPASKDPEILMKVLIQEFVSYKNEQKDDRMLQWIAACAMSPTLFWDWVLYSGQLLGHPGEKFLTLSNLYKITRLPWFSSGRIPEDIRLILLEWLEKNHPHTEILMRAEWQKVLNLEENLPPIGSLAWQGHRVQVLLNELLQNPSWNKRRSLELELDVLLKNQDMQDAMLVKYLHGRKTPLDNILSDRFRKYVQEKQGILWRWRNWTWQVSGTALSLLLSLFMTYSEPVLVCRFKDSITSAHFSTNDSLFLAAGLEGSFAVCNTDLGTWNAGVNVKQDKIVEAVFSNDGTSMLVGTQDGTLKCWDISGAPLFSYKFNKEDRLITAMKFTKDCSKVLVGYYNGEAKLWDVLEQRVLVAFNKHSAAIMDVDISPDGQYVLTGSRDSTARVWSIDGRLLKTLSGHKDVVLTVCFSPDGTTIATGSRDETAIVWRTEGAVITTLSGHKAEICDVCFTPDSKSVITASGDMDKSAKMWSLEGLNVRSFEGHRDRINSVAVSADGSRLLTGSSDGTVRVWRLVKQ